MSWLSKILHKAKLPNLVSAPKIPDYAAGATRDLNSARSNQVNPWGSSTWTPPTTPGGQWTQETKLSPDQQAILDSRNATAKARTSAAATMTPWAVSAMGTPIDYSKFNSGGTAIKSGNYYNQAAGDAVYKQFADRMDPEFARSRSALETQMRNQGIGPGDAAWDDQIRQHDAGMNDARERARQDAVQAAGAEGSRMQGMDVNANTYNDQQRADQIAQEMQKRGYGVQEMNALNDGQDVVPPSFMPSAGPNGGYADAMQNTYAAETAKSNAKAKNTGSWINTIGSAVKAFI